MARQIKVSQATAAKRRVYFQCRDATNGLDTEPGEGGGQPQISTDGGGWTNAGIGVLVHIGAGRYYAELTQAAVDTAGRIIETRYKSANTTETVGDQVHVIGYDPDDAAALGLSSIDAAVSSRASQTSLDTLDDYVDTEVAAIKAKTDNLPASPAAVGSAMTLSDGAITAAVVATGAIDADALATDAVAEIAAGMAGTGVRTVTLHCQTSGAIAIGTVSIAVYDSANTQQVCTGTADANGDLQVQLDDGSYKARAVKAGYTFALASITITANETKNVTGSAVTITAPSAANKCVVYGYARDAGGVIHAGAVVTAQVLAYASGRFAGGYFLTTRVITATTSATGLFEIELHYGAVVNLDCAAAGITLTGKTVPSTATQDITTW